MYKEVDVDALMVDYFIIDAKTIKFNKRDVAVIERQDKIITAITVKNEKIDLFDTLLVNFKKNTGIEYISKYGICEMRETNTHIIIIQEHINLAHYFILPTVVNNCSSGGLYLYISNTFIDYKNKLIIIKCRPTPDENYLFLDKTLTESPLFKEKKYIDKSHSLYVYYIPDVYVNDTKEEDSDLKLFVEGQYSKMSKRIKNRISSCFNYESDLYKDRKIDQCNVCKVVEAIVCNDKSKEGLAKKLNVDVSLIGEAMSKPNLKVEVLNLYKPTN